MSEADNFQMIIILKTCKQTNIITKQHSEFPAHGSNFEITSHMLLNDFLSVHIDAGKQQKVYFQIDKTQGSMLKKVFKRFTLSKLV